jgi:EH_Signature domain
MNLELSLKALPKPRIGIHLLKAASQRLKEITDKNIAKTTQGSESPVFKNLKEEMKRRLIEWDQIMTFDQVTNKVGRERILISLYMEYAARPDEAPWLPRFNDAIALSVLGADGREWHVGRLRQATQLFFTHFDRLPALDELCIRISESFQILPLQASNTVNVWHQYRTVIFAIDGPQRVALAAGEHETLMEITARMAVPNEGRFSAKLKECFLLSRLQNVELGKGQEILQELESLKDSSYEMGISLGAAALRIMTRRVLDSRDEWKGNWPDWILKIGCDPSIPQASQPFGKWWGCWHPTHAELVCAQRGINRQTLEYFITVLKSSLRGTSGYDQFESRARFLRRLDDTQKIIRFKLLLHPSAFQSLPKAYQLRAHQVTQIEGSTLGGSIIVMECIDRIWIAEGTHSFAIRVFQNQFPVPVVFSEDRRSYRYLMFTQGAMHKETCTGIWKAHMGDWLPDLLHKMAYQYHIEWSL